MPCNDGGAYGGPSRPRRRPNHLDDDDEDEDDDELFSDTEEKEWQAELDTITRLACAYCRRLEREQKPIPEWAQEWWLKHRAIDTKRIEEERKAQKRRQLRAAARSKLSLQELEALREDKEEE